jgi:hypothetical protein
MIFRKRNRAEQNEKNYSKWLKTYIPETTKQRIELTRVFTDRQGNNFYILKNPANLTRERAQRIEEAMTAIDFGIHKNEVVEKLTGILETVEDMPWQNMTRDKLKEFHTKSKDQLNDIIYRLKSVKIDDLLLEAGLYFFYIDNENPYIINSETQQRKMDAIKKDDELRAFFLNSIEQILKGSSASNV